ncbi:MAG: Ig-like domain-containing protein [Spirochaetes bacterium]|nr:Ig-like domain-containing protein [Spirochaetota bacterium]
MMKRYTRITALAGLLLLSLSCVKESPTVSPADVITGGGGVLPGYYYPAVQDVYPANGSTGNPVNTKYVIVFNIPIVPASVSSNLVVTKTLPLPVTVLVNGVDYTISFSPNNTAATITFSGALPDNSSYNVDIPATIIDATNNVSLNNPGVRTFSVGSSADTTKPEAVLASRTPAPGANNISLTAPGISIQFTEAGEIDATTLNYETFFLQNLTYLPSIVKVSATISYNAGTNTATLTPSVNLETSTNYRVNVTTGIEDLSGNSLLAGTPWDFTTTATEIDPLTGDPFITSGISIDSVTDTEADLSWITSEATNYNTFGYGRNIDATPSTKSDPLTFSSMHTINLTGLTPGKRYYATLQDTQYSDVAGNTGTNTSIVEFNTITADTPALLAGGAANQHTIFTTPNRWGVASPGFFAFWTDMATTFRHIYRRRFDNTGAPVSANTAVYAEGSQNFFYLSAAEDGVGGAIVMASRGGSGIYAKRVKADGSFEWGGTEPGITIDATGTQPSAVPVYANIVEAIVSGTTEHGSLTLSNYFYDKDMDLSGLVDGVDIAVDTTGHTGSLIDNTGQDFRHILGQASAEVVALENYAIGLGGSTLSDTAWDYSTHKGVSYTSGNLAATALVYAPQTLTVLPGWVSANDIIKSGTKYGQITAFTTISITPATITTGKATNSPGNHLVDSTATWTTAPIVTTNDIAFNDADKVYMNITAVEANDLTLSADASFNNPDTYYIYQKSKVGADETHEGFHLVDAAGGFTAGTPVQDGDIVYNVANGVYTTVAASGVSDTVLALSSDGQFNAGEAYIIYTGTPIRTGITDATSTDTQLDDTSHSNPDEFDKNPAVSPDDMVVNTTDSLRSTVAVGGVSPDSLVLNSAAGFSGGGDTYEVYKVIRTGLFADNTANHLYDSQWDFVGVAAGDLVYNVTDNVYKRITARADNDLTLDGDAQLVAGKTFQIFTLTQIDTGTAENDHNKYLFNDSVDFLAAGVQPGHLAYNDTDGKWGVIQNVETTALTLDNTADFSLNDDYTIYDDYFEAPAHPFNPFYEFTVNYTIGIADTDPFTLYDTKLTGIADPILSNPLYDNDADFTLAGISANDIALNFTLQSWATVSAVQQRALNLDSGIFADNNMYQLINFYTLSTDSSHIIAIGTVTTAGTDHLIDSTAPFASVQAGDVACNLTDTTYALVTARNNNGDLTISPSLANGIGDRYIIVRQRGMLYAWQDGADVHIKILSLLSPGTTTLVNEWSIAGASNPTAVSNDRGSAILIYVDNTGDIRARLIDGAGNTTWNTEVHTPDSGAEAIVKIVSDNSGGAVILYTAGAAPNNLRVQRISAAGATPWGTTGIALTNPAAISSADIAYDSATDNFVVTAGISGDIWARGEGSTWNWTTWISQPSIVSTQQNPKVFLNLVDPTNSRIVWEDNRFLSFAGYAIFGMEFNATTGVKDIAWFADATSTDDDGIAFVLNDYNEYWPNIVIAPYGTGADALILWEDWRTPTEGANIFYRTINAPEFAP